VSEPAATAATLAVLGLLMALSVLVSRVAGRISVPVTLLFLAIGMVAGAEKLGGVAFADYGLAFRLGTVSLVLILFDGGLNTPLAIVKRAAAPAALLATVGVLATAGLMALAARALGLPWPAALLLGAIVSPTDAAVVFSVLRGTALTKRVATTLELESGLNDPLAVMLTVGLTALFGGHPPTALAFAGELVAELIVGAALGAGVGLGGRWLLHRVRPSALGLLPVLTVALAFGAFGTATLLHGSGFLATYVAAILIGNGNLPYRSGLLRVHDGVAWMGQVIVFVVIGILAVPTQLWAVAPIGLGLGMVLAFVARPLATALCLLPFRFAGREIAYMGWVGLRGAVPIILAIFPVLANVRDSGRIFDVVFFIVVVNALVPGATVRWVTRKLGMAVDAPPIPTAVLEIASTRPMQSEILSYYIDHASAVAGARLADVPFPSGAAVVLIVRGEELLPARGDSVLAPGDHVYVFCRPGDKPMVGLLFGQIEE
jgi:cell volume regulation protein A